MNFKEAAKNFKHPFAKWNARQEDELETLACNRIYKTFLPYFQPKFKVWRDASVFTMGSCFAWEIQRALRTRGFDVPSFYEEARFSDTEGVKDGAFFTRFNIGTMRNEIHNLYDGTFLGEKLLYDAGRGALLRKQADGIHLREAA